MRAQRENLNIVFGKVPPEMLAASIVKEAAKGISHREIPLDLFVNLSLSMKSNCTKDERREQHNLLMDSMNGLAGIQSLSKSVFNTLYDFSKSVLTTKRYVPICKYDCLLRWNDTSHDLGQDLFTTSFLAFEDVATACETDFFAWNPIIDTTNERLYKILKEGLAENHYHLYGSSQCFSINWISIMNEPDKIDKRIDSMDLYLNPRISYSQDFNMSPWFCKLVWASYIRCYLFRKINEPHTLYNNVYANNKNEYIKNQLDSNDGIKTDKEISEKNKSINANITEKDIREILMINSPRIIQNYIKKLKSNIQTLKYVYGFKLKHNDFCFDYALLQSLQSDNFNYNRILVGERKFLYDCFRLYAKEELSEFDCNILYLYILIKLEFRHELIQSNREYGFKNFSDYQKRKLLFVKSKEYFDETIRLALNMPLESQPLLSLEARIMPERTKDSLKKSILSIDNAFLEVQNAHNPLMNYEHSKSLFHRTDRNYFFVIHYPKGKYRVENSDNRTICRNETQRQNNKKYTNTLVNALKYDTYLREAIKGIDACSNEIGCRPETFATDFRYLREVIPAKQKSIYGKQEKPVQLKLTYHVGEDFLNIADGLRAIDEAIIFLNMRRCDRIGHALALGVDAEHYYRLKDYRIIMPKQDILDDDVWLLYKASEFNIQIEKSLEQVLIYRIQDNMRYIYGKSLQNRGIPVDPFVYYNSWMLRGDNPELYSGYIFDKSKIKPFGYEAFMVNNNLPSKTIRQDEQIATLYGMYHYDEDVKRKGIETDVLKITPDYIRLVKQIQKKMQFIIAEKGIAIECNPSSNYLIGTFRRYDKHPITKFNNMFLEHRQEQISDCAQISVSVNTDDQGVFDTSLTNEYALLALALEKKLDENGERMYSASSIYQYLDYVRKMGIEQTFSD